MKNINTFSFLIHDYETFGKNPALDRPAQFACIRTNFNFQIIEKPTTFLCRISDDYLPEPEAVLLHGITPQKTIKEGMKEADFAKKIYRLFNVPNTCILGYNNLDFDDEISRNIFYRNFFDPYNWSYKQGNSRWDMINIVKACYSLRPEGIKWPLHNNGLPNFKLEHFAATNGIINTKTHDALSDVYTTLKIAKLIKNKQPKLFKYLYKYRKKYQIKTLIDCNNPRPLLYIPKIFKNKTKHTTFILPLIWHPHNKNILIAYDLDNDIIYSKKIINNEIIINQNKENNKKNTTEKINKVIRCININKCPTLAPATALRQQDIIRLNINIEQCNTNLNYLNFNNLKQLKKNILKIYKNKKYITTTKYNLYNVDNQLYKTFFQQKDKKIIDIIQNSSYINLSNQKFLSQIKRHFIDSRLQFLLFNYRARNFPKSLNNEETIQWKKYKKTIFKKLSLNKYINKLQDLYNLYKEDTEKTKIIHDLFEYYKYISINN